MNQREIYQESMKVLKSINTSGTTMLCPSSCDYHEDFQNLEFDNVILCSTYFEKTTVIGKVFCIKMNESELLGRLCQMGVKINAVINLHNRYSEEDCRQLPFFNKMMPLFADEILYFSNHDFFKENLDAPLSREPVALPDFIKQFQKHSDTLEENITGWCFKKINTPPTSLIFPNVELVLHRASIWGKVDQFDMTFMKPPTNPYDSGEGYNDRCNAIRHYLFGFGMSERKLKYFDSEQEYRQSIITLLEEAAVRKLESVAFIPFSGGGYEIIHEQLKNWTGEFPKEIHIFHLHQDDFDYFYKLPEAVKSPRISKYEMLQFIEKNYKLGNSKIQTANELINLINNNSYRFKKNELFEILSIQYNREMEMFYTPDVLAELIKGISEIYRPKNVIDICCGTGNTLSYFENIKSIRGIDINKAILEITQLINPNADIEASNVMEYDFKNERYEFVICHPPFGLSMNGKRNAEIDILKKGLAILTEDGVAIFVTSNNLLTSGDKDISAFRKDLFVNFAVDMVISLPDFIFSYTNIKTSVLVIRNGNRNTDIFMPNFEKNTSTIIDSLNNHNGGFYLPLSNIDESFRFDKEYYLNKAAVQKILEGRELIKLSDIAEVIRGEAFTSNVNSDGLYSAFGQPEKKISNIQNKDSILEHGDIVVSLLASPTKKIKIHFYEDDSQLTVISPNYVIIRSHNNQDREYLNAYMRTEDSQTLVRTCFVGSKISISKLKVMQIPRLSESELDKLILESLKKNDEDRYFTVESQKCLQNGEYENAKNWIEKVKDQELKDAHLQNINNAEALAKKDKELEDMMSMFAHKFRSPLDAIIYNTHHENNPKLYIEAAQTMRGLLDIFSIISTDEKVLKGKIKTDNQGNSGLLRVLGKTLNMILLHLLSASGTDKIQQHYMAYAKVHGKIDSSVTPKIWNEDYFELERNIQTEWEISFSELLSKSGSLQECLDWIERHFFKLELIGFERDDIQFKEYSVTESFLTILFNEILVNAFKYYSSESKQSVVLELDEGDGNQIIICRNPSVKRERTTIKGSGKGHVFLSALASKIGSIFFKPKPQDDFVVEFAIPSELLISNQGGKK